jgi:hypothetical protein
MTVHFPTEVIDLGQQVHQKACDSHARFEGTAQAGRRARDGKASPPNRQPDISSCMRSNLMRQSRAIGFF